MPGRLHRLIALLLVPCFLVDPAFAYAGSSTPSRVHPSASKLFEAEALSSGALFHWQRDFSSTPLFDTVFDSIAMRVRWLAVKTVHYANFARAKAEPELAQAESERVGGHEATSASMAEIVTAIEAVRNPEDIVVMVPHASPAWYSFITLMLRKLPLLKKYRMKELPAYPSPWTPELGFAAPVFGTGSLGKVVVAMGLAAAYKYEQDHGKRENLPNVWITVGDGEMSQETLRAALWYVKKYELSNVKVIVNYNLQRLDAVPDFGNAERLTGLFKNEGFETEQLKYGRKVNDLGEAVGGLALRKVLDSLDEREWLALWNLPASQARSELLKLVPDDQRAESEARLSRYNDEKLPALLKDVAGHDLPLLINKFETARDTAEPTAHIVWTVKGKGVPGLEADIHNHSHYASPQQVARLRERSGIREDDEWADFPMGSPERAYLDALFAEREAAAKKEAAWEREQAQAAAAAAQSLDDITISISPDESTQSAFARWLIELDKHPAGNHLVVMAADVLHSVGFSSWTKKRGLWAPPPPQQRISRSRQLLDYQEPSPQGQTLGLANSEQVAALWFTGFGKRPGIVPIMGIYDEFIVLIAEMLRYADYSGARGLILSMVTSPREGAQHESFLAPAVFMGLPHGLYYDPAFPLDAIWMEQSCLKTMLENPKEPLLAYVRAAPGKMLPQSRMYELLRAQPNSPYADLSNPAIDKLIKPLVLKGGYRLMDYSRHPDYKPGKNVRTIFATGKVLDQAIKESEALLKEDIFADVVYLSSPSLLRNEHRRIQRRNRWDDTTLESYLDRLVPTNVRSAHSVAVIDAEPLVIDWIGGALGMTNMTTLGKETFSPSMGREEMLHRQGLDAEAIRGALDIPKPLAVATLKPDGDPTLYGQLLQAVRKGEAEFRRRVDSGEFAAHFNEINKIALDAFSAGFLTATGFRIGEESFDALWERIAASPAAEVARFIELAIAPWEETKVHVEKILLSRAGALRRSVLASTETKEDALQKLIEAIVDNFLRVHPFVFLAEGTDPVEIDSAQKAQIRHVVQAWLEPHHGFLTRVLSDPSMDAKEAGEGLETLIKDIAIAHSMHNQQATGTTPLLVNPAKPGAKKALKSWAGIARTALEEIGLPTKYLGVVELAAIGQDPRHILEGMIRRQRFRLPEGRTAESLSLRIEELTKQAKLSDKTKVSSEPDDLPEGFTLMRQNPDRLIVGDRILWGKGGQKSPATVRGIYPIENKEGFIAISVQISAQGIDYVLPFDLLTPTALAEYIDNFGLAVRTVDAYDAKPAGTREMRILKDKVLVFLRERLGWQHVTDIAAGIDHAGDEANVQLVLEQLFADTLVERTGKLTKEKFLWHRVATQLVPYSGQADVVPDIFQDPKELKAAFDILRKRGGPLTAEAILAEMRDRGEVQLIDTPAMLEIGLTLVCRDYHWPLWKMGNEWYVTGLATLGDPEKFDPQAISEKTPKPLSDVKGESLQAIAERIRLFVQSYALAHGTNVKSLHLVMNTMGRHYTSPQTIPRIINAWAQDPRSFSDLKGKERAMAFRILERLSYIVSIDQDYLRWGTFPAEPPHAGEEPVRNSERRALREGA